MSTVEGMAPLSGCSEVSVRRWAGERGGLYRKHKPRVRRDTEDDDGDSDGHRFGFRDGNGGGNDGGDGSGRGPGFFHGGRFGGNNGQGNGDGPDNGDRGSGRGNGRPGDGFGFGFGKDKNGKGGNDSTSTASTSSSTASSSPPPPSSTSALPQTSASATPASTSAVPSSTTSETSSTTGTSISTTITVSRTAEADLAPTSVLPLTSSDATVFQGQPSAAGGVESSALQLPISSGPTTTPVPNTPFGKPFGGWRGFNDTNRFQSFRLGMDKTTERALISVGSIGGFILVSFVVWLVWRMVRKSKRRREADGSGYRPSAGGFASKFQFFRRRQWQNLDDSRGTQASPPPSYREKTGSDRAPPPDGFFAPEKLPSQPPQLPWPLTTSNIPPEADPAWPAGAHLQPAPGPSGDSPGRNLPNIVTDIPKVPPFFHQPQDSFSSTNAAHFGAMLSGDPNQGGTLQTGASPTSHYNNTLLTQQFTAPYQPLYRQPSRAISEVSSMSSGFGDGGELMPAPPPPAATAGPTYAARFSWMAASAVPGQQAPQAPQAQQPQLQPPPLPPSSGPTMQRSNSTATTTTTTTTRRETVYTEASEDQPARFRSVRSWVAQQTGRVRRGQQRARADDMLQAEALTAAGAGGSGGLGGLGGHPGIPGVHNPPPGEQWFGLMMDDEERPRRVSEVV